MIGAQKRVKYGLKYICTGKSFSEVLILASTNPQYDKRLFIVQYMKITSSEHFTGSFDRI